MESSGEREEEGKTKLAMIPDKDLTGFKLCEEREKVLWCFFTWLGFFCFGFFFSGWFGGFGGVLLVWVFTVSDSCSFLLFFFCFLVVVNLWL